MFTIRLLDVVALILVVALRAPRQTLRAVRSLALCGAALAACSYALPPATCSCFGPVFRRCDNSLRYVATLKSDLRNLSSQQEIYFLDHGMFSSDAEALGFWPSNGSRIEIEAGPKGWSAVATHAVLGEDRSCTIEASLADEHRAVADCVR
jgi:hypothetical protein